MSNKFSGTSSGICNLNSFHRFQTYINVFWPKPPEINSLEPAKETAEKFFERLKEARWRMKSLGAYSMAVHNPLVIAHDPERDPRARLATTQEQAEVLEEVQVEAQHHS